MKKLPDMTTKSYKPKEIKKAFDLLSDSLSEEEKIESEARLIMFRFLSIIEEKCEALGWNRKQLAEKVGTSPSYMTQLYRGDKMVNLVMLAKFQKALNLNFEITEKRSYAEPTQEDPSLRAAADDQVQYHSEKLE